jgi:hypothetical protein
MITRPGYEIFDKWQDEFFLKSRTIDTPDGNTHHAQNMFAHPNTSEILMGTRKSANILP